MNLMSLTAVELGKKIKSGEVRVVDAVNAAFDQIEAVEKDINSYVTVYKKEEVLEKAEHIQKLIPSFLYISFTYNFPKNLFKYFSLVLLFITCSPSEKSLLVSPHYIYSHHVLLSIPDIHSYGRSS